MEGVFVLKSHPWLWITILVFSFINICYAGIIVVLIPWLFNVHHHFEAYVYGLGMASSGVGAVVAALIFGGRERWYKRGDTCLWWCFNKWLCAFNNAVHYLGTCFNCINGN